MNFQFLHSEFFILILIPILFLFLKNRKKLSIGYPDIDNLNSSQAFKNQFNPEIFLKILRYLSLLFLIIALSRPQEITQISEEETSGVDIILNVDVSESMKEYDFIQNNRRVNRLHVVKQVLATFIDKRKNDRIGLVVFGSEAFLQCPLTTDYKILKYLINDLVIGIAGKNTSLADSIGVAVKRFISLESKSKIIILLTDGRDTASTLDPIKVANIAKQHAIKIYTIGVGAVRSGNNSIFSPFRNNSTDIDETTLKSISKITGAKYFRASDTDSLIKIYDEIDKLEKSKFKIKTYTEVEEKYLLFALIAMILLIFEFILKKTYLKVVP